MGKLKHKSAWQMKKESCQNWAGKKNKRPGGLLLVAVMQFQPKGCTGSVGYNKAWSQAENQEEREIKSVRRWSHFASKAARSPTAIRVAIRRWSRDAAFAERKSERFRVKLWGLKATPQSYAFSAGVQRSTTENKCENRLGYTVSLFSLFRPRFFQLLWIEVKAISSRPLGTCEMILKSEPWTVSQFPSGLRSAELSRRSEFQGVNFKVRLCDIRGVCFATKLS